VRRQEPIKELPFNFNKNLWPVIIDIKLRGASYDTVKLMTNAEMMTAFVPFKAAT